MSEQSNLMVAGILSSASGQVVIDLAKGLLIMKDPTAARADQAFISSAALDAGKVDAASIKVAALDNGSKVMAGWGSDLLKPIENHLVSAIRLAPREELGSVGLLHRSNDDGDLEAAINSWG